MLSFGRFTLTYDMFLFMVQYDRVLDLTDLVSTFLKQLAFHHRKCCRPELSLSDLRLSNLISVEPARK